MAGERVAAARARLALAEANLARRHVRAPTAGVILSSRVHAGEYFNVGGLPLLVLGDTSKLQARLEVDEVDAFGIHDGASCAVFSDDNRAVGQGTVYRAAPRMGRRALAIESPTARADIRVREVYVELPGSPSLLPGQRVWGHIVPVEPSWR